MSWHVNIYLIEIEYIFSWPRWWFQRYNYA